jgi:heptosyltransferase II
LKILVFATHGLGDLVMAVPGLLSLSRRGVEIDLVVKSKVEGELVCILRDHGLRINQVWFLGEYKKFNLIFLLYKIFQTEYDVIYPTVGLSALKYNMFASLLRSPRKVFFNYGPWRFSKHKYIPADGMHKSDINKQILSYPPGVEYQKSNDNSIIFNDVKRIDLNVKVIILAPGSGSLESHKRWPIEYYNELSKRLIRKGYFVKVVGSPAEKYLLDKFDEDIINNSSFESLIGKTNIKTLLGVLNRAKLLVSNCNGISHLASLTNIKILGLYGPTSYKFTGPSTDNLKVIKADIVCSPCYRRGYIKGCKEPVCMKSIGVDKVFNLAKEILENEL